MTQILQHLPRLTTFIGQCVDISSLPDDLPCLVDLNLHEESAVSAGVALQKCTNLTKLVMMAGTSGSRPAKFILRDLFHLSQLVSLKVRNYRINRVRESFSRFRLLETLVIDNCVFGCSWTNLGAELAQTPLKELHLIYSTSDKKFTRILRLLRKVRVRLFNIYPASTQMKQAISDFANVHNYPVICFAHNVDRML